MIDRIAPTRRPDARVAGYQKWRDLAFLHWRVPAAALRPVVPAALELDDWRGEYFVGVVPFTMRGVRPWWAPAMPGVSTFHETNLRTYVHRDGRDPGVWFFSLEAANRLAVWIARTFWHLPYHHATMSLEHLAGGGRRYDSVRRRGDAVCRATCTPVSAPEPAAPDTLEHFLAERYVLYASSPRGLRRGRVHHSPYPLQTASASAWQESLFAAAGLARPDGEPLAHFASGVDVAVFPLESV